jgi:PAS domain S-box-containing protein
MAFESETRSIPPARSPLPNNLAIAEPAIVLLDEQRRILTTSPGVRTLFGYDQEELIGHPISALFDVHSRPLLSASLDEATGSLHPEMWSLVARTRAGEKIDIALQIAAIGNTQPGIVLLQFYDLQPLLEANQKSERLAQRYRNIFETNVAVKLLVDIDRALVVDANSAAAAFYGYEHSAMLGLPLSALYEHEASSSDAMNLELEMEKWRSKPRFFAEHRRHNGALRSVEVEAGRLEEGGRALVHAVIHDVTQRRKVEEQLRRVAYDDLETGLPNRASFRRAVSQNAKRALARGQSLAVVSVLLTEFRDIANTLENATAVQLVRSIAAGLEQRFPHIQYMARLSDSMLGLCLLYDGREQLDAILHDIVERSRALYQIEAYELSTGICVGAAMVQPDERADTPIRQSHLALDLAVARSREFVVFSEDQAQQVLESIKLASFLRRALDNEEFTLVFQPQVLLADTAVVVGAEALLRWHDGNSGRMVPPDEFIPVAERTGLIVDIGDWVLRTACRNARQWLDEGMCDVRVSVNVSAVQFRQADLLEQVQCALDKASLPAQHLELEITESVMVDDAAQTIAMLEQLRAIGVRIAMDDFGTGYSSMSYLRELPLDRLKIDRQFVFNMVESAKDKSLVNAIVAMAKAMSLDLVAEGIECANALAHLQDLGVQAGQGYYFYKPISDQEMLEIFRGSQKAKGSGSVAAVQQVEGV